MSTDQAGADSPLGKEQKVKPTPAFEATLSIRPEPLKLWMREVGQIVREAVREELAAQGKLIANETRAEAVPPAVPVEPKRGVELPSEELLKARDLRIALLLGKVPENAGLLIDTDTTAQLMSVSQRRLNRLVDEKAIPAPIRIAGRLVRWRLSELLEWIEAGCPHSSHWTYSSEKGRGGKKGR